MAKLIIFFDNAPSLHREGIIQDMSKSNDILLIHLPLRKDKKHFSELFMKDFLLENFRLKINLKLSKSEIIHKIEKFVNSKLHNNFYSEILIIHSFLDIFRLNLLKKLCEICKSRSNIISVSPIYEPIRLNDLYLIPRLIKIFKSLLYQKILFNSKKIFVFSTLNSFIYRLFFTDIILLPYKNNSNYLDSQRKKEINLKPKSNKYKILFIGKLIKRKNPILLINAFEKIKFNSELTIIGDGPLRKEIIKKCSKFIDSSKKSINIIKEVENQKIRNIISKHDVLVLPSKFDGFGFVVHEAINAGVYTVVSNQVGAKDLLKNGKFGSIFKNNDLSELYNLLTLHYVRLFMS